jgi:hypothetical protein
MKYLDGTQSIPLSMTPLEKLKIRLHMYDMMTIIFTEIKG